MNLLRAFIYFVLFTSTSAGVRVFREGHLTSDILLEATLAGGLGAILLYFWHFWRAKNRQE